MRIAHVSDCYLPRVGGIELHVRDLARRQAAAGHEVTVLTTTAAIGDELEAGWAETLRPGVGRRAARPGAICYRHSRAASRVVREGRFDIVHVHASAFSPLAFLAARAAALDGVPTVATLHSLWAYAAPLFRTADRLTGWGDWPVVWSAVSGPAAAPLRRVLDGRAEVAVLPNGIDPALWTTEPVARPATQVRLVAVMRLAPRKRPLPLLRILREVRRRLPASIELKTDIIGAGPEWRSLARYLDRHDMGRWVRLRGNLSRSEIRSVYASSDLFVAPATMESFGIAALEARCAGLPVVARADTGIQQFITDGDDGRIVGSDADMIDALAFLAAEPEARRRLSSRGRPAPAGVTWREVLYGCDRLYRTAALLQGQPWSPSERVPMAEAVGGLP